LSELSKAQIGEKLLDVTTFEVQAALRTALEGFFAAAEVSGQALRLVMPDGPVMLQADAERFQQMILNLVDNALKYAPGGSVTVSLSVEGASVVVRVDDDGVGIAPESLHGIFELFTRETRGGKAPEGLGVGLSVVKELAHAHGGMIEARSPGKDLGSVFTLRLPLTAQPWRIKDDS
jgi:two-component system CheB/CheR fusion protein